MDDHGNVWRQTTKLATADGESKAESIMPETTDQNAWRQKMPRQANPQRKARVEDRNSQLDLLRSVAILMVVAYHLTQTSPKPLAALMSPIRVGEYGVDLFFVLSGWLIGGLYWREQARFGSVDLPRFWVRRWLRTIPPYLVALALAWMAVRVQRHDSFNWGYLFFIQNYYERLPFFLVSWSLCIEEHFYVFVPLLLLWARGRPWFMLVTCVSLIMAAPLCRCWLSQHGAIPEFGFKLTATHLRLEGLLLGFSAAYVPVFSASRWFSIQRFSRWVGAVSAAVLILIMMLTQHQVWMYRIGLTALAALLTAVLIWLVEKTPGRISSSRLIKAIALSSYSVYLTHALCLHMARVIVGTMPAFIWFAYFPIATVLVVGGGAAFYFTVERTCIQMRDRLLPRRMGGGKSAS
jgi:peptidoglycan/LPS O-acetylase OafA/YrhL